MKTGVSPARSGFLTQRGSFSNEPHVGAERIELRVVPIEAWAPFQLCRRVLARVHTSYERSLADLAGAARVR